MVHYRRSPLRGGNVHFNLYEVRKKRGKLSCFRFRVDSLRRGEMLTQLSRLGPALPRLLANSAARFVSQSSTSGAAASNTVTELQQAGGKAGHGEVSEYVKNPDYHGFSSDPVVDVWNMRVGFFFGISVALVIGGTFIHYLPDHGMRQWARREAERVIQQREKEDLPLIEENYYDPNKIIMPTVGEA